jgi:hypothetical protein
MEEPSSSDPSTDPFDAGKGAEAALRKQSCKEWHVRRIRRVGQTLTPNSGIPVVKI